MEETGRGFFYTIVL